MNLKELRADVESARVFRQENPTPSYQYSIELDDLFALLDVVEAADKALGYLDGVEIPYVDRHRPLIALSVALSNLTDQEAGA